MIDVVFLLLVFFVWTSSFQIVEKLLPSHLSIASGNGQEIEVQPELLDLEQIIIRLSRNGATTVWQMNDEPLGNLDLVQQRLSQLAEIRLDLPVIIDPDEDVSLGDVIRIYDIAMQLEFESIRFAAE